jgi:hypothetical protein
MATKKEREEQEALARSQVGIIKEENLALMSQLDLALKIRTAKKEELNLQKEIKEIGRKAVIEANKYSKVTEEIKKLEEELIERKQLGQTVVVRQIERELQAEKKKQAEARRTTGGQLRAMQEEAKRRKESLEVEQRLIKDINKQRTVGSRIMDLFRSKEARQQQIDKARAKARGGSNIPTGKGGTGGGGELESATAAGAASKNPYVVAAGAAIAGAKKLIAPMKEIGKVATNAIVSPFADAAKLLTGEDFGMGSGKVRAGGVGSLLGGIQEFASSIPIIGGFLSSMVGVVKTIVEGILGVEQGIFRFARAINVSYGQANRMRSSFAAIAASSGHIAINEDRMMQSQAEIGNQLGINKQLSGDILKNDVLLRDVIGTEAGIRQKIAETAITSGQSAITLTRNIIKSVDGFNRLRGTGFSFNGIMKEVSKLSGVVGLMFAQYPQKIANTVMQVKTLGFDLEKLDNIAGGFLDFEESISKEMEAQVITGKELNLTRARQAALDNDYATLAEEITKQVGKASDFTKMKRIEQDAIADAMRMSRGELADILKNQELYKRLGATDLETFHKKIELLERQGKTQAEISQMIGKDAYNSYTQISTAERITEILEKMKRTFVELIKQSGIFDFITSPEKITSFVRALADKLASVIDVVGRVVATMMEGVAYVVSFFSDEKAGQIRMLAGTIRGGTGTFAESIRVATGVGTGEQAPSVGRTVQNGARQEQEYVSPRRRRGPGVEGSTASNGQAVIHNYMVVDGQVMAQSTNRNLPMFYGNAAV